MPLENLDTPVRLGAVDLVDAEWLALVEDDVRTATAAALPPEEPPGTRV